MSRIKEYNNKMISIITVWSRQLKPSELKVLCIIFSLTLGSGVDKVKISNVSLEKILKMSLNTIKNSLKTLCLLDLIKIYDNFFKDGGRDYNSYSLSDGILDEKQIEILIDDCLISTDIDLELDFNDNCIYQSLVGSI